METSSPEPFITTPTSDRRYRRVVIWHGEERTVRDLAREHGIDPNLVLERLDNLGWSVERAFKQRPRVYRRQQRDRNGRLPST